jgi:hypothetical protein
VNAYLPKAADCPPADERREPVNGTLIKSERNRGHRELFAMAYEDTALTVQPDRSHDQRGPVGVRHEALHQIDSKPEERSRLFAYKLAIDRSRPDCLPVENVNISGDIVFRRQRPQLLADEFSQSALTRHCLRFLGVGELVLRERVNGIAQYLTVQPLLGLEVVVYCRLIDVSLCRKRADAGRFIAAFGK